MMDSLNRRLFEKIRDFPLDPAGACSTFAGRLARENGWTESYARRVIDEYKRFAFLGVAAGHPVSPSDAVDQAWHLHMTYTRSYWEEFCPKVLGRTLHHEPSKGGEEERRKLAGWYGKTLLSYRAFFGEKPPEDIWPDPESRNGEGHRWTRVNLDRHLILSRRLLRLAILLGALAAAAAIVAECPLDIVATLRGALNLKGSEFLGFYALSVAMVAVAGVAFRWSLRGPEDGRMPSEFDLDPYEAAVLAGSGNHAANAAMFSLLERKVLLVGGTARRLKKGGDLPPDAHPLERALVDAADGLEARDPKTFHAAAQPVLRSLRDRLVSLGFLLPTGQELLARLLPAAAILALTGLGVEKIIVGHERHRPIAFLVLLVAITTIGGLVFFLRPLRTSRRGDRALRELRQNHEDLRLRAGREEAGLTSLEIPMAVALFGMAALTSDVFLPLRQTLDPPPPPCGRRR